MFLLIPSRSSCCSRLVYSLHSTMFLLIQIDVNIQKGDYNYFTFHYVSINTKRISDEWIPVITLHSTMFLLIQCREERDLVKRYALHSTMFLLILPCGIPPPSALNNFTFHYVSINTLLTCDRIYSEVLLLYIPLCFY